jgi:hypothetical protein
MNNAFKKYILELLEPPQKWLKTDLLGIFSFLTFFSNQSVQGVG